VLTLAVIHRALGRHRVLLPGELLGASRPGREREGVTESSLLDFPLY